MRSYDELLGKYVFYKKQFAKIIGVYKDVITIELLEEDKCPNCDYLLGKKQVSIVYGCRNWQTDVEAIPTL